MKPTKTYFDTLRAYKDRVRLIALRGSSRSGKTAALTQLSDTITTLSAKHRKISVVSQSFPHLKDGFVYEFKKHMARENIYRPHNKAEHEFYIKNSIINYFALGDDESKAVGPGRDILWINEPNRGVTFESYVQLRQRTSETIFVDWNPSGDFWLQEEGILNEPSVRVLQSTWLDNLKNLSRAQIDDFINNKRKSKTSAYWDYWWKVYGLGQDAVLLDERVMPFLKSYSKLPDDAIEIPSGLDFGFFPAPTWFGRMWIQKHPVRDRLFIREVIYDTRLSINAKTGNNLTDRLLQKGVNTKHRIIAESADPRALQDMRAAQFNIEAVSKTSVDTSIRVFHDYDIFIHEDSDNTYKEFDKYRYKRNRKGEIVGTPADGQADHSIDGSRYVLMSRGTRWNV
jgi:phage terminase large subunit